MKSTEIVRRVDDLGRVVIPKELRRTLGVETGDALEIFVEGETVMLRKYVPGCVISGSQDDLISFGGKLYSRDAIKRLAKVAGI